MKANDEILKLWSDAQAFDVAQTYRNICGDDTGNQLYAETVDAFGRSDGERIVRSAQALWEGAPDALVIHSWPAWSYICDIAFHIFDDDFSRKRVPVHRHDPNINMYSEAVAPDDNIQQGGLPAPDLGFEDLAGGD